MLQHTQQSVTVANNIFNTRAVEAALMDDSRVARLGELVPFKDSQIAETTKSLRTHEARLERHKHVALCIQDIAQRDNVSALAAQDPRDVHDFAWQCQLRTYWELAPKAIDGLVRVEIMHRAFSYGCEYLGNRTPLVWTESLYRSYKIIGSALRCVLTHVLLPASHARACARASVRACARTCMCSSPCVVDVQSLWLVCACVDTCVRMRKWVSVWE